MLDLLCSLRPLDAIRRASVLAVALAWALAWWAAPASAAPSLFGVIDGQGSDATIAVGSTVDVFLYASEIPPGSDGNGLFGFGFSIGFDEAALDLLAGALGPLWTDPGTVSDSRQDPGDVGFTAGLFDSSSGPQGDFILLASYELTASSTGIYGLDLTHFVGAGDNVLFDGTQLDGSEDFFVDSVVTVVPEPASGLLLAAGLAWLTATRRSADARSPSSQPSA